MKKIIPIIFLHPSLLNTLTESNTFSEGVLPFLLEQVEMSFVALFLWFKAQSTQSVANGAWCRCTCAEYNVRFSLPDRPTGRIRRTTAHHVPNCLPALNQHSILSASERTAREQKRSRHKKCLRSEIWCPCMGSAKPVVASNEISFTGDNTFGCLVQVESLAHVRSIWMISGNEPNRNWRQTVSLNANSSLCATSSAFAQIARANGKQWILLGFIFIYRSIYQSICFLIGSFDAFTTDSHEK